MSSARLERWLRQLVEQAQRLELKPAVEETFGRWQADPVGFCTDVLGAESAVRRSDAEPYQFSVLADLVEHPRVAVRSGHGVGKSAIDAWAALWWLLTRPLSRVVVLAPEYGRQIRAILFSEARKWAKRARVKLPVEVLASRIRVQGHGEEWSATGMSTAGDPDRLEGFHAEGGVLVIVDEMKGVPQDAFDAVQGALSGLEDSRLLVTSVPGGAGAGPFWKACVKDADRWVVHHVPSTDSSLVSPQWVEDRARDWGLGSPLYQARVEGEFADAGEGVLFPLALLEAAMTRVPAPTEDAPAGLGVDVARSVAGDLCAIAACDGGRLRVLRTWHEPDSMKTVAVVLRVVAETGVRAVAVDVGGPGGGVADRLRQLGRDVAGVYFGGGADDPQRFRNKRAELLWRLRERLERGEVALDDDDEVRADLSALRYGFTADGRILAESKDDVRKRLGRSPDRADALALALEAAMPAEQDDGLVFGFAGGPYYVRKPGEAEGRLLPHLGSDDPDDPPGRIVLGPASCGWFPGDPTPLAPDESPRTRLHGLRRPPRLGPDPDDEDPLGLRRRGDAEEEQRGFVRRRADHKRRGRSSRRRDDDDDRDDD